LESKPIVESLEDEEGFKRCGPDSRRWNQNRLGSFEELPENFRSIVMDNVKTIHDLEAKQPVFKREEIRQIKVPTLVKGETSHKILRDIADSLSRLLPNVRLEAIDSGHFPQFEKPEILNLKILDFLDKSVNVPQ
jgi:pimeloyl-ACP methyl ester carboxylesterase